MNASRTYSGAPASPDVLESLTRRRSRRRSSKRLRSRLSSPIAVFIGVTLLAVSGVAIANRVEQQRMTRALMTPKVWAPTTLALSTPAKVGLTTTLSGAFLHYTFTITPGAGDAGRIQGLLETSNFTIRLLDKDGFAIVLLHTSEDFTKDRHSDGSVSFRIEDVVGCSPRVYATAVSWSVEQDGHTQEES